MNKKCAMILIAFILGVMFCFISAAAEEYQYAQVNTTNGPLNMRETPSGKADVIEEIPNDTYLQVTPHGDTWCITEYNGKTGYVMTKFLAFVDPLPFRELSLNTSGEDVLAVKERLRELNYFGGNATLTDTYGAETVERIKLFQAMHGMEVTGTLTPKQQALLLWGPTESIKLPILLPENYEYDGKLATIAMTVTVSAVCSGYNHVGNSWSQYYYINDERVNKGDQVTVTLGESMVLSAKITEKDSTPDVGRGEETRVISQEDIDGGFTVEFKVSVREDKGQYSGNKAVWTVTFKLSP